MTIIRAFATYQTHKCSYRNIYAPYTFTINGSQLALSLENLSIEEIRDKFLSNSEELLPIYNFSQFLKAVRPRRIVTVFRNAPFIQQFIPLLLSFYQKYPEYPYPLLQSFLDRFLDENHKNILSAGILSIQVKLELGSDDYFFHGEHLNYFTTKYTRIFGELK